MFGVLGRPVYYGRQCSSRGDGVLLNQVLGLASRSNSALVSYVCVAALRASYNAPQRER